MHTCDMYAGQTTVHTTSLKLWNAGLRSPTRQLAAEARSAAYTHVIQRVQGTLCISNTWSIFSGLSACTE